MVLIKRNLRFFRLNYRTSGTRNTILYFTRAIEKLLFFTMMVKLRMISFQRLEKNLSFISVKLIKCPPLSHTLPYHTVLSYRRSSYISEIRFYGTR